MNQKLFSIQMAKALLTLTLIWPRLASGDEQKSPLGTEIEEPVGLIVDGDKQCFYRDDWATMGDLITHYHWTYRRAGLCLGKESKQAEQIQNITRHRNELLEAQNQTLINGEVLQMDLENERRKKRIFAGLAGVGAGVSIVLGLVVYGVAK